MRMYLFGTATLTLLVLFGGEGRGRAVQKSDKDKLQGTWTVVSMEKGGKTIPEELLAKASLKLVFDGNKATMMKGPMADPDEPTFTMDSTKSPKQIDITDTKGKNKGKTQKGIYVFDGDDKLTIAVAKEEEARPNAFKTKEDSLFIVVTLKREKGK